MKKARRPDAIGFNKQKTFKKTDIFMIKHLFKKKLNITCAYCQNLVIFLQKYKVHFIERHKILYECFRETNFKSAKNKISKKQSITSANEQVVKNKENLASNKVATTSQARENSSSRENSCTIKIKIWVCKICGNGYNSTRRLKRHERKHT